MNIGREPGVGDALPPAELTAAPVNYDELADELSRDPATLLRCFDSWAMAADPVMAATVLAAGQRCSWMQTIEQKPLQRFHHRAARTIVQTGHWGAMLGRVDRGRPSACDLQLVLGAARPDHPELHIKRRGLGHAAVRAGQVVGVDAAGDKEATGVVEAQNALQGFAHACGHGMYNRSAPHLLAIGCAELVWQTDLLDFLDVRRPNRVAIAFMHQLDELVTAVRTRRYPGTKITEGKELPGRVHWVLAALKEYHEKTIAYAHGQHWVADEPGLWEPRSRGQLGTGVLVERRGLTRESNRLYKEFFNQTPGKLDEWLGQSLKELRSASSSKTSTEILETIGAAWAAVILRCYDDRTMGPVVKNHHAAVRQVLEPYVLSGLPLVAKGRTASLWLSQVTLHSWAYPDSQWSVFSPNHGPVAEDQRRAGEALSAHLMIRYGQEAKDKDGKPTHGYHSTAPQIGIACAYLHVRDLIGQSGVTPQMTTAAIAVFSNLVAQVKRLPRPERAKILNTLPGDVRAAVHRPGLLLVREPRVR